MLSGFGFPLESGQAVRSGHRGRFHLVKAALQGPRFIREGSMTSISARSGLFLFAYDGASDTRHSPGMVPWSTTTRPGPVVGRGGKSAVRSFDMARRLASRSEVVKGVWM